MTITKILKLSSGEEIICNLENDEKHPTYLSISDPMKVQSYPRATRNGIEEALTLQRWVHFADNKVFDMPKTQVIVMANASYGLSKFYEYCVKKMNHEEDDVVLPTRRDLKEIEEEEWDEEFGSPDSKLIH